MPLSLIELVLGLSFVLIWMFIGTIIFRDSQFALRGEREAGSARQPAARSTTTPSCPGKEVRRSQRVAHERRGATAA